MRLGGLILILTKEFLICSHLYIGSMLYEIYQTQETVFFGISKHWQESFKHNAQQNIFDEIWGVWIANETLSWVFDVSSQLQKKIMSKQRSKIIKIYAEWDEISKPLHDCDFLCFYLINYEWEQEGNLNSCLQSWNNKQ